MARSFSLPVFLLVFVFAFNYPAVSIWAEFNEPHAVQPDVDSFMHEVKQNRPKVVVIYIANDALPDPFDPANENLLHVERSLRHGASQLRTDDAISDKEAAFLSSLATRLRAESRAYHADIQTDKRLLHEACCLKYSHFYEETIGGFACLTNSGTPSYQHAPSKLKALSSYQPLDRTTQVSWQFARNPEQADTTIPQQYLSTRYFTIKETTSKYPFASQPLTRADVVLEFFKAVRAEFDPLVHRYILIVKSHGSDLNIVAPCFSEDYRDRSEREIARAIVDWMRNQKSGADLQSRPAASIVDQVLRSSDNPVFLDKEWFLNATANLIRGPEEAKMRFPLIVFQTPNSQLEASVKAYRNIDDDRARWFLRNAQRSDKEVQAGAYDYTDFGLSGLGLIYTTTQSRHRENFIDFRRLNDLKSECSRVDDMQDAFISLMRMTSDAGEEKDK